MILTNTNIVTSEGIYQNRKATLEEVCLHIDAWGGKHGMKSAIGHESTAKILTELLGFEVKANRVPYEQREREVAIVFKLKGRPPEGKILSKKEIETIGYDFYFLVRLDDQTRIFEQSTKPQYPEINKYDQEGMASVGGEYYDLYRYYIEVK